MNKANFTISDNFPVSQETYDFLQNMILLNEKLAKIGGENYILEGCEVDDNGNVSDGYIVINGEVLPFVGSVVKTYVEIVETRETVQAFGVDYPDAYITRFAQLSHIDNNIEFTSFKKISSNAELLIKINEKSGSPVGVIEDWAGKIDKIPSNYLICTGQYLFKAQYPDLYDAIGETYGVLGTTQFKLPDFRGRVSVGYSDLTGDYNAIGATGGAESVELLEANLPSHTHGAVSSLAGEHDHFEFANGGSGGQTNNIADNYTGAVARSGDRDTGYAYSMVQANGSGASDINSGKTSEEGDHAHDITIYPTGADEAHENRMPYLVLPKIIKAKY